MLDVSNEYKNTIISSKREFLIKVIINDREIESKYLKGIKIEEISCSKEMISIGDVCSNAFELEMFILDRLVSFDLAKVVIKSGLKYDDKIEWVDLGTYIVNEVTRDKYSIKLSGFDAMKRFEEVYNPNIIFNDETKFIDVLNDLLRQCKVLLAPIDLNEYENIIIDHYFEGITCKELIGYLAGLMGCNVRINRVNELEFYWYQDTGIVVSDELIYQDSYQESLENELVINSLTSGDETNTYVCGSGNGISFANPYMTQELLDKIFLKIEGFSYQPCSLKWRGNPCIENSDIIKYNDKNIIIMKQTLILDGGFSSQVECMGKLDNDVVMKTSSPTEIKLNKLYNTLTNALKHSTETILGQHGGNLVIDLNSDGKPSGWTIMNTPTLESYTKLWKMNQGGLGYSEDGGKTFKNIAFDLEGNFNANIINTGVINGEMFELDLQTGVIRIGKRDNDGEISSPSFYLNENGELKINGFYSFGENLIHDSIGVFNDGSWEGSFNLDSTNEIRNMNSYGYAILLKKGNLKQHINVVNGTYTLSFIYKKLINLAKVKVIINGEEFALSNNSYTEFKHLLNVTIGSIEIEFVSDTENACPIINLMLNKGDQPVEWSLNPNETWSDTVQIGRGIRISSSGTDVIFVANADIIGFMNKQGEYITTFDNEGLVASSIIVKNKATIVNLLIQDINNQTVINRINPEEVEVIDNGK